MEKQPARPKSTDGFGDVDTWIMLVALLVLAVLVGLGGLAITRINQQTQTGAASQAAPAAR